MTTNIKSWISAFRLRTLPLAIAGIGMGGFLAASVGGFQLDIFLLTILTAILLQILSNVANDYGDSINGADNEERVGPSRAVQDGLISSAAMKSAMIIFIVLSLVSGVTLLYVAFGWNVQGFSVFLGLGLLSVLAAIAYTVGKKPYGYIGLGDISVLIFFGLLGVIGSFYLQTKILSWQYFLPALSCGLFSIAVLNVNNIRDIESDTLAGKYSIPVRIGRKKAIKYHWFLLIAGFSSAVIYTILNFESINQLLFLAVVPMLFKNGIAIAEKPSSQLDPYLKQMAMTTLFFVLSFGTGLLIT